MPAVQLPMPVEDLEWQQEGERVRAHYSSLTLHRKCPQAWYYRYDVGLRGDREQVAAPERDFGSWWGALRAAEALERGRSLGSLRGKPKKFRSVDDIDKFDAATVTVRHVAEAASAWWEKQSFEAKEEWATRLGDELPSLLSGKFERWLDEYAEDRKYERPIAVELFWDRVLPKPEGDRRWDNEAGQLELYLLGFIDEVYEDTQRGLIVARDSKTSKGLANASAVQDMMDSQLHLYAWGATPTLAAMGVDPIRAVGYDRMLSKKPATPQLTLTGTLSKAVTNFDLKTYLDWATEDTRPLTREALDVVLPPEKREKLTDEQKQMIRELPAGRVYGKLGEFMATGAKKGAPKFGIYQPEEAMIEKLSQKSWRHMFFQRTTVPLSSNIVRAHLRSAVDTATDIWRTQNRAAQIGEAARNFSKDNCTWCDFASLCRAQVMGGPDGEYELAEHSLKQVDGKTHLG